MLRVVASPCRPETSVSCRDGSTPGGETCRVCERTAGGNSTKQSFDTGCILTEGDAIYDGPCSVTVDIHEGILGYVFPCVAILNCSGLSSPYEYCHRPFENGLIPVAQM
ncbi:Hypp3376 [Branchiostoma lanceolatum]|uniref:Hypp3376 protein n=1 Tax=Branchiostoma lanceolatum TaxID=7740 RepID=A0A8K0A2P8_BRALA|nr:Hypp3376 [Branchiostoma lanceolatum]